MPDGSVAPFAASQPETALLPISSPSTDPQTVLHPDCQPHSLSDSVPMLVTLLQDSSTPNELLADPSSTDQGKQDRKIIKSKNKNQVVKIQISKEGKEKTQSDCSDNLDGLAKPVSTSSCAQLKEKPKGVASKRRRPRKDYSEEDGDYESKGHSFKFPYINEYILSNGEEYLSTMEAIDAVKNKNGPKQTFLNCDVRYFNWSLFISQVGKFDVLIIDPPWRIKGAQQNDTQFMFSNCKFSLEYNTMSNSEIARIPLHLISEEGFIFLWILNSQLDSSVQIMQTWGYELVDEIVWVKLKDEKINLTHGYYFMHSYEICLVGYKGKGRKEEEKEPSKLHVKPRLSSNTLFAQVRQKSQKPQDLYAVIEMMFRGQKKIEIFARNHNMKFGVFSIGNELGESYDKWKLMLSCDKCECSLACGRPRYKSKKKANYDLCEQCVAKENMDDFFHLKNKVDENIRHEYLTCNHCQAEPIWGIRFECVTCNDYDLCENCYDKNLSVQEKFHPIDHNFNFLEVPVFGNGFQIHESKCSICYQNPIIGVYFNCLVCKSFKLCQKCFFERPSNEQSLTFKRHKADHQMEAVFEPQMDHHKVYECFWCRSVIEMECHMCENCFNFFFCQKCYDKKEEFKSLFANSHKKYHEFSKIF